MANFRFKFEDSDAPEVLQHLQKDINLAASKGYVETVKRLLEDGADANYKDIYGRTPLHYAANDGHTVIVNILLKYGADVTQVTNKGSTPLHTASYKGYKDIVEVLLQHISHDKLHAFVNAKTTTTGDTSLHVAAKGGYLEVAKTFLKHGATYNSANSKGQIPSALSEDQEVTDLLMLTEEMFSEIKKGNAKAISRLRGLKTDEFFAITNARDSQGNTLFQVAVANKHENITGKLSKIQKLCELDQLKRVKYAAELQIIFSDLYLPTLRRILQAHGSEQKALEEGSYYLQNAHHLVEVYKDCVPGSIDDENIQSVNDMLVALEFDPKHITSEYTDDACSGTREFFVSKGQGTKYYKLLCSELKENIRSFIEMVEINIDIPVKRFLKSTKQRLQCDFSEQLFEAIQNDDPLTVENCIKVIDVNFKDSDGRTPLHHAVNNGNIDIVNILLNNDAEVTQITNKKGNTPLHIASSKGFKEIVDILLQHISRDKRNSFVNAKTTSAGNTSLHFAAKGGYLEVVKSLLKHGATYNSENNGGELPVDLSVDQEITNLLKLIEELFTDTRNGDVVAISKLRGIQSDELFAITNALNSQGDTLFQVAIANKHENIAGKLLQMQQVSDRLT